MEEEVILIGVSQLTAVFAGFVAIFMAFVQSDAEFTAADALRARVILYSSFAVVFASLAPLVLWGMGIPLDWAWRAAAGIYLVLGLLISIDVIKRQSALKNPAPCLAGLVVRYRVY